MRSEVRVKTTSLPGNRVEVTVPGLPSGQAVEVILLFEDQAAKPQGVLALLESMPEGPRSAPTWEAIESSLLSERDAWRR